MRLIKQYFLVFVKDGLSVVMVGLILRLLVMPFTLNWDLWNNSKLAAILFEGGFSELYASQAVGYPPLTFAALNLNMRVLGPLFGNGFFEWLKMQDLSALTSVNIFRYLFLLKIVMVLLEVATGVIVSRMVAKRWRQKALVLWMLNPVIIYLVAGFTNVDAWPMFFVVLSMWFLRGERKVMGSAMLGVAVALKLFPVFLFPFLLVWASSWRERLKVLVAFVVPVVVGHLPILGIESYGGSILTGGNSQKIFFSSISVGLKRFLIYYVFLYSLIWFAFVNSRRSFAGMVRSWFLVLALMFVVSAFHVQWFYWLMPFLVAYFAVNKRAGWVMATLFGSYVMLVLVKEASLHVGMLSPIEATLWFLASPAESLLGNQVGFYLGVFHSVMGAALAWIGYELVSKKIKLVE